MRFRLHQTARSARAAYGILGLFLAVSAAAQTNPFERTFSEPRSEVESAVASAKASFSGKLPALEGFVGQTQQPVERYERAYYQCLFQVIPSVTGETSVRVTAKITAWYDDPDKQRSGYQVLPSNGRLENDALDRVQEILEGPTATPKTPGANPPKLNLSLGPVPPSSRGSQPASGGGATARPALAGSPTSATEEEIEALRAKRAAGEKRVQQLRNALKNLQELYDSQTTPANLVVVRSPSAPIFQKPDDHLKPLFNAVAKDQFEMIEIRGDWVHIQISGESRGWIRRSFLELPDTAAERPGQAAGNSGSANFEVTRDAVAPFSGNWPPLIGKNVKIFSVQPAKALARETTAPEKRAFAQEVFQRAWKESQASPSDVAGVVIVFDSADGGQASVTLDSIGLWQAGKISAAELWHQCSLDPPETFDTEGKKH